MPSYLQYHPISNITTRLPNYKISMRGCQKNVLISRVVMRAMKLRGKYSSVFDIMDKITIEYLSVDVLLTAPNMGQKHRPKSELEV